MLRICRLAWQKNSLINSYFSGEVKKKKEFKIPLIVNSQLSIVNLNEVNI